MTSTQKEIRIDEEEAGGRLDRVLAAHITELSRTRLKTLIEAGSVAIDGRTIRDPGHRVNSAPPSRLRCRKRRRPNRPPKPFRSTWFTRTPTLLLSTSPRAWWCIRPPDTGPARLVNALVAHCGESLSGIGGERRPGIVHRLDKDTTGLIVVAKNDRAHRAWRINSRAMAATEARSSAGYLAFVWGAPDRPRGTIDRPIDRHKIARDRMAIREGGREAVTHWEVLERYGGQKGDTRRSEGGRPGAADRQPAGLPARNRPDPSNPRPFGLDRSSLDGR